MKSSLATLYCRAGSCGDEAQPSTLESNHNSQHVTAFVVSAKLEFCLKQGTYRTEDTPQTLFVRIVLDFCRQVRVCAGRTRNRDVMEDFHTIPQNSTAESKKTKLPNRQNVLDLSARTVPRHAMTTKHSQL